MKKIMATLVLMVATSANVSTFDTSYVHLDVQSQIKEYRRIYDGIPKIPFAFSDSAVPELWPIFARAMALVHTVIANLKNLSFEEKKPFNETLQRIYEVAMDKSPLTPKQFLSFHLLLANIVDEAKTRDYPDKSIKFKAPSGIWVRVGNSNERIEDALERVEAMEDRGIGNYVWPGSVSSYDEKAFFPPMIIHTLKGTSISPNTFVDQSLHQDYGGGILLFDASALPCAIDEHSQGRVVCAKREVHHAFFNGTYNMMRHDLSHHSEQFTTEEMLQEKFSIDWREQITTIKKIRDATDKTTYAFKLLTNGIFILTHELFNVTRTEKDLFHGVTPGSTKSVVLYIKDTMKEYVSARSRGAYKTFRKDQENALQGFNDPKHNEYTPCLFSEKAKELDQHPYCLFAENFKNLSAEDKETAVKQGFEKFWNLFIRLARL